MLRFNIIQPCARKTSKPQYQREISKTTKIMFDHWLQRCILFVNIVWKKVIFYKLPNKFSFLLKSSFELCHVWNIVHARYIFVLFIFRTFLHLQISHKHSHSSNSYILKTIKDVNRKYRHRTSSSNIHRNPFPWPRRSSSRRCERNTRKFIAIRNFWTIKESYRGIYIYTNWSHLHVTCPAYPFWLVTFL